MMYEAPSAEPAPPAPAFGGSKSKPLAILSLIVLLAAALRCWGLGTPTFWLDEFLTVELSSGRGFTHLDLPKQSVIESPPDFAHLSGALPLSAIWTNSTYDVHPPLFYMVLRLWRELIGDNDFRIRMLTVLCSLASTVLLYYAVETNAGTVPALWAAALMAVAGPHIQLAQYNRSYMLLLALLLGAAVAVLRIERFGFNWRRALALGICAYGAAMTHYLGITLLFVLGAYVLICFRQRARLYTFGVLCLAGAIYLGTWGPFALAQQRSGFDQRIEFVARRSEGLRDTLAMAATLPLRYFTNARSESRIVGMLGAALFILPLLLLRRHRSLLFWWMWLAGGVGFVLVGDLLRDRQMMYWIRYTLAASPGAYAIAAIMLSHLQGLSRHIVPLALCVGGLISVQSAYDHPAPDWRGLGAFIDANFREGDLMVMDDCDPELWKVRCDIVGMNYYADFLPMPLVMITDPPGQAIMQRIRSAKRVWYFMMHGGIGASERFPTFQPRSRPAMFPYIGILQIIEPPPPEASPPAPPATQP
jgi:hypothetical protein